MHQHQSAPVSLPRTVCIFSSIFTLILGADLAITFEQKLPVQPQMERDESDMRDMRGGDEGDGVGLDPDVERDESDMRDMRGGEGILHAVASTGDSVVAATVIAQPGDQKVDQTGV